MDYLAGKTWFRWTYQFFVIGMTFSVISSAHAHIYVPVDRNTEFYFTDIPTSGKYKVGVTEKANYSKALCNIKSSVT